MDTDERLVLYQTATQDIRELKANQWRLSHYGLLIQAALVAVYLQIYPMVLCFAKCGLTILAAVTFLSALAFIHEAQDQIVQRRRETESLGNRRDETIAEWAHKFGSQRTKWCRSFREPLTIWKRDRPFAALFFGVQFLAVVLAIMVMWFGKPAS